MDEKQPLGRLTRVHLREYWEREDTKFTPWLAETENLKLLSETVGIDLEAEQIEAAVGPYRADILCRDIKSGTYVLIENQLEPTDHLHLGQLMTYSAGHDAINIIWIAQRFNDEHRAALDWLNRITLNDFRFFGIEVELWKIGDSPAAPKFNVVVKPNDWSKAIITQTEAAKSKRANMYRQLWGNLIEYLSEYYKELELPKPSGMNWIRFPLPDARVVLSYASTKQQVSFYLLFRGETPIDWFQHVRSDSDRFEDEIGKSVDWREAEDGSGYVYLSMDFDHHDEASYKSKFAEIGDTIKRITDAFNERYLRLQSSSA
jgi:hypothetical protein